MSTIENKIQKISTLVNNYQKEPILNDTYITENIKSVKPIVSGLSDIVKEVESTYKEKSNLDKNLNIGIMGAMKTSKTSSINTLMLQNSSFKLPVDALPETASIVNISYAANKQEKAKAYFYTKEEWAEITEKHNKYNANEKDATVNEKAASKRYVKAQGREVAKLITTTEMHEVPFSNLKDYVSDDGKYTPIVKQMIIEVTDPSFQKISLTDTPGLYDPNSDRSQLSDNYIKSLDFVFFFSAIDKFLTEDEMEHLIKIAASTSELNIIIVASRFDSILFQIDPSNSFVADCESVIRQQLKAKEQLIKNLEIKYKNDDAVLQILNKIRNFEVLFYSSYFARYIDNLPPTQTEKNTIAILKQQYTDFNSSNVKKFGNTDLRTLITTCKEDKTQRLENNLANFEKGIFVSLTQPLQEIITKVKKLSDFIIANKDKKIFEKKKGQIDTYLLNHKRSIEDQIALAFDQYINTVNERIDSFIKSFNVSNYQRANTHTRTERRFVRYTKWFLFWDYSPEYENVTIIEGDILPTKQKISGLASRVNTEICSIIDNLSKNKELIKENGDTVKQLTFSNELLKDSLKTVFKDAPIDIKEILNLAIDNIVDTIEHKQFVGIPTVDLALFNQFGNRARTDSHTLDAVAKQTVDNFMVKQKAAINTYKTDWSKYITGIKTDFEVNIFSKINEELEEIQKILDNSEEVIKKQQELIDITNKYIAKCQ